MRPKTAYKRVGDQEFDHKKARAQLQSASGRRGQGAHHLLDEEDMENEREMKKAQNRLKRRTYEELAQDDEYKEMFDDPLDRYDEIIQEVPSQYEEEEAPSMEESSNIEGRGLLQTSHHGYVNTQNNLMPIEESKRENTDRSIGEENEEGIKFINEQEKEEDLFRGERDSVLERNELLEELKKSKGKINRVLKRKEKHMQKDVDDYDEKFKRGADEDIMEVGAVDLEDLETEFDMIIDERERKKKQRELEFDHRRKGIELTSSTTQNKLANAHTSLLKDIAQEEIDARKKAVEREKIIRKEFRRIEGRVSGVIKEQRSKILSYFGPLVQEKKKSAYTILGSAKKKVDLSARTKICLPFSIKIKMLRCVKDKIRAGTYVVLAEIIDRIGGASIMYNYQKSMKNLLKLKHRIKEYEALKLRFLKEQNIDVSTQDTEGIMNQLNEEEGEGDAEEEEKKSIHSSTFSRSSRRSQLNDGFKIDEEKYERLTFQQRHTRYRDFHAGYDDEEFYVDENLYLLYPPMNRARPSNCIQFRLVKLSNETELEDEVIAWGVFPLLNSELAFNEGRFKIPLLYGDVDEEVTLYRNIQSKIMTNLDNWLCNMYIEVEPLLIQKLEFDWIHKEMYYEKEELNKIHGYIIKKQEDLNESMIQQDVRRNLLNDNKSHRSSSLRKKSKRHDSANLIKSLEDGNINRSNSRMKLKRQETHLLETVINDEHLAYKKEQEREIRDELDDDALMLESYTFSVSEKFNYETRNVAKKKLVYLFTESLADMGLKNMNTIAFQITLFVIILSFWARMYIHYFGQYLALLMCGIGVSKFDPQWYKVTLHYEAWEAYQEGIIIILGILMNTLMFSIFISVSYVVNKYTQFPHIFYKMMCWFGIATCVDFLVIFIVDCIEQEWDRGDMFKLYYYYNKRDGNGWPGFALTVLIYAILLFLNLSLMYYYLIFIHMGGRVIDIYHRLSGNVNHFFLPHDDEISLTYLKWVCAKALKFNHRVVNDKDKVVDERGKEVNVHFVKVYKFDKETHDLTAFRSFIRDYDGAIREMHINKIPLDREKQVGITYNLPHNPKREAFDREVYFPMPSEESKQEGEGESDKEDTPFNSNVDNMNSKMNLREEVSGSMRRSHDMSNLSDEDRKINLDEEEESYEPKEEHKKYD